MVDFAGLPNMSLQEVATAVGINVLRAVNHLHQGPITKTRISGLAKLAY
jgi:hypothetical protein